MFCKSFERHLRPELRSALVTSSRLPHEGDDADEEDEEEEEEEQEEEEEERACR